MKRVQFKHFECACSSPDHLIRFVYFPEDDNLASDLYIDVQLNNTYSFFKRIWLAIKYICGYTKKYGHWDCSIIKPEDYADMILLFKTAEADYNKRFKRGKYGKATKNK